MIALLLRELRAARLWVVLWAAVFATSMVQEVLYEVPVLTTQGTHHAFYTEGAFALGLLEFIVAFTMGQRVMLRELDDGSIRGLDVLPVSRAAVYAAKLLACATVLLAAQVFAFGTALAFTAVTRDALDPGWALGLTARECLLSLGVSLLGTAAGMALAAFGTNAWMALILAGSALFLVGQFAPGARGWNPLRLHQMAWMDGGWVLPTGALWRQGGLAVTLLLAAGYWFRRAARRDRSDGVARPPGVAWRAAQVVLALAGVLLMLLVALGLVGREVMDERIRTRHYAFVVLRTHTQRAHEGIGHADDWFERVQRRAGVTLDLPLPVDVTAAIDHLARAGDASGLTIRLAPAVLDDPARAERVLLHETTHVFGRLVSQGGTDEHHGALRVFDEGLATAWSRDLAGPKAADPGVAAGMVLAMLHGQRTLRAADVTDFDDLAQRHDPDLAYPLGEAFIRAMEDAYGPGAPLRVLRALRADGDREELKGEAYWRQLMAAAGMSYDVVTRALFVRLDATWQAHRTALASLPPLLPDVVVDRDTVRVSPHGPGAPDREVRVQDQGTLLSVQAVCRFRDPTDDRREQFVTMGTPCVLSRGHFAGPTLAVQVGDLVAPVDAWGNPRDNEAEVAYRPWIEVRIDGR